MISIRRSKQNKEIPAGAGVSFCQLPFLSGLLRIKMIRKLAGLCVSDKRKSLLYEVIALAKLVDSLMDQVAAYFVKAVSKIV